MRIKLLVTGSAISLVALLLLVAATAVPLKSHRVEYAPSCGHSRWCVGGLLKDSGCKELTDREARPFAPLSACADPWLNVFSDDLTLLGGWMHGTGGRDATGFHFGEELVLAQRIYREHSGMFVGSMEILRTIADAERFRGFRIEPCEGVEPLLKPDRFVVPLAADQDGDGEVECWTADDQGRVRRLHDD